MSDLYKVRRRNFYYRFSADDWRESFKGDKMQQERKKKLAGFIAKILLLIMYLVIFYFPVFCWEMTYGGTGYDSSESVQQTLDGGYISAGLTSSYGAGTQDVYLVKTDASGTLMWEKTFGGVAGDQAWSVQQTSDGGFIIGGETFSFGSNAQVYLIKTDAGGSLLWEQNYGGIGYDLGFCVRQTIDGGFIITGETNSFGAGSKDAYLIKTDASGSMVWSKTYGGSGVEVAESVIQTSDGGYIITGWTTSYGAGLYDAFLIKTDSSGTQQWFKPYGGAEYEIGFSVRQTSDGGYVTVGETSSFGYGDNDVYLLKTDSAGNEQWYNTYGGTAQDWGFEVEQTADDGFIITGFTSSGSSGLDDVYVVKTDSAGMMQWQQLHGGGGQDEGNSIGLTSDGGCIVSGINTSWGAGTYDAYLIKIDGIIPTATSTPTMLETGTITPIHSITDTETETQSATVTESETQTETRTFTGTVTETWTMTATKTVTETTTVTNIVTATETRTGTATATKNVTMTITETLTQTAMNTSTSTGTQTLTPEETHTITPVPSITPTLEPFPEGEILAFPNPFPLSRGLMKFTGVPQGAFFGLYTITGEYIRSFTAGYGVNYWNGRNYDGHKVSPGIYYYVARHTDGRLAGAGKLFVVY